MTRTQWALLVAVAVVAGVAYARSNAIAKYLGISGQTLNPFKPRTGTL